MRAIFVREESREEREDRDIRKKGVNTINV